VRKDVHKLVAIHIKQHEALVELAAKERRSITFKVGEAVDLLLEKQAALETDMARG
jgi:hypothetical protein